MTNDNALSDFHFKQRLKTMKSKITYYYSILLLLFMLIVFDIGNLQAAPKEWTLDKGHAHIGWDVYHMGLSRTNGRFNSFDGTFMSDEDDLSKSTVSFSIDASSIDSNHTGRDNHLRTKDYLHVDQYPNITFKSNKLEMLTPQSGKLYGDLTLRGVTAPIELDFNMVRDMNYPSFLPNYDELRVIGFEATGEILRLQHKMDFIAFLGSPTGLSIALDLRFDLVDCSSAKPTNVPCNWGYVEGFKGPSE